MIYRHHRPIILLSLQDIEVASASRKKSDNVIFPIPAHTYGFQQAVMFSAMKDAVDAMGTVDEMKRLVEQNRRLKKKLKKAVFFV